MYKVYNLVNKDTSERKEMFCTEHDLESYLKENKSWGKALSNINISYSGESIHRKVDDAWRDRLREIKTAVGPRNNIEIP